METEQNDPIKATREGTMWSVEGFHSMHIHNLSILHFYFWSDRLVRILSHMPTWTTKWASYLAGWSIFSGRLPKAWKEKFGLFVDFEFLTEMGSWGTDWSIPVGLKKSSNGKWLKTAFEKNAHVPVFRAEMIVTQYVLSSSRHLVTPLIYVHFCVWLGLFVDRWWLKEVWYAPVVLSNCRTCVPVAAPGITRRPSKRTCRGTLSQKTRNWPTCRCKPVHVHERSPERRRNFDPA